MVLNGGTAAMTNAEFCLLEVTLLNFFNELLLIEVLTFMDKNNFQAYEITQLMHRNYDTALYQIGFDFINKDSLFATSKN